MTGSKDDSPTYDECELCRGIIEPGETWSTVHYSCLEAFSGTTEQREAWGEGYNAGFEQAQNVDAIEVAVATAILDERARISAWLMQEGFVPGFFYSNTGERIIAELTMGYVSCQIETGDYSNPNAIDPLQPIADVTVGGRRGE